MRANEKAGLTRRDFIRTTAGAVGAITAASVSLRRTPARFGDTAMVSSGALCQVRWASGTYEVVRPLADAWARSLSSLMRAMDVREFPSRVSSVGGDPDAARERATRVDVAPLPTLLVEFPSGAMIVLAPAADRNTAAMRGDTAVSVEARAAAAMAALSYRRQRRVTFEDARGHLRLA